jgi:hypothetical membrane protein
LKSKRAVLLKLAGLCGVIGPIISLLLIAIAIAYSPWFNWFKNALSDLGVGEAALIFNSGLIIGGVLTTMLAVGLIQIFKKQVLGFLGSFTLVLSSISLLAIGLFAESAGRIHFYVSVSFFVLLVISLFLIGAEFLLESSQRYLGVFSILASVVAGVAWAIPHEGVAVPEIIASLSGSAWSIVLGVKILQNWQDK